MNNQTPWAVAPPDLAELQKTWQDVMVSSGQLYLDNWLRWTQGQGLEWRDDLGVADAFAAAGWQLSLTPWRMLHNQTQLWQDFIRLSQQQGLRTLGVSNPEPIIAPEAADRRFKDEDWAIPFFDVIKQAYLLYTRCWLDTLTQIEGLDPKTARKVSFYARQFIDALSPANFALSNPEVWREALRTGGVSLVKGLRNLFQDMQRGRGKLHVRATDPDAFRLGENIAATPGKVVYRTEMMELLQYHPTTEQVKRRPLLIVPPWINKFYILDLRPKNSFIKWAVDQGHTVFVISWVNPSAQHTEKTFEDYLRDGVLAALDAVAEATGEARVNAVGYCLGGTLLCMALAYLAQAGAQRVHSVTLLTTLLDFGEPGELGVFLDETQINALEKRMQERGFLEGSEMASTFSLLRANDLIWSFFVNNYLLGRDPLPFDLLHWNSDSTRMPAAMHGFYLRNMYLENRLRQPGGIRLNGQPIDLGQIQAPAYFLSALDDHIAPWKTTYAGTQLFNGPVRFVLAGSGHIAGVINPPAANKYSYWLNHQVPEQADEWLSGAKQQPGSWWSDWQAWIEQLDGESVAARIPGEGGLTAFDDAPGAYVRQRLM